MNKTSQLLARVEIIGASSLASPENVFRGQKQAYEPDHFKNLSHGKKEARALRQLEKLTGGPRESYTVKLGGDKLNYNTRTKAPKSAVLVRPGEHVPVDFGSEYLTPIDPAHEAWVNASKSKPDLLAWFESTPEGKASLESLERLREQAKLTKENLLGFEGIERAIHGTDEEYQAAVDAATRNDDAVRAAEKEHFDKAHMKHVLAKDPGNTEKVLRQIRSIAGVNGPDGKVSIPSELLKPGIDLPARQTPAALRAIGVDKNGKVTGKPSAERIRDTAGNLVLAESIEASPDDIAADKSESAKNKIQKTSDKTGEKLRVKEDNIAFLAREVARLEREKAEHGLGPKQSADLIRLTRELKAAQTRLANDMLPIKGDVRIRGVRVITDTPDQHKVGTQTCPKHQGKLSCKCHREVLLDASRGITKRAK